MNTLDRDKSLREHYENIVARVATQAGRAGWLLKGFGLLANMVLPTTIGLIGRFGRVSLPILMCS